MTVCAKLSAVSFTLIKIRTFIGFDTNKKTNYCGRPSCVTVTSWDVKVILRFFNEIGFICTLHFGFATKTLYTVYPIQQQRLSPPGFTCLIGGYWFSFPAFCNPVLLFKPIKANMPGFF